MHSLIFVSWLKPLSFIHLENDNEDNLPEDGCGLGAQNTNMLSHQLCDLKTNEIFVKLATKFCCF